VNKNNQIKQKIIEENIKLSKNLAKVYDVEHGYMRGNYIDKMTNKDVEFICSNGGKHLKQVLDVGGGTGFLSLKFLKRGCSVDVVDISPEMLGLLQKKINKLDRETKGKIKLLCGNAEDKLDDLLRSEKKYDIIVCSSFLHHIYNYEEILDKMLFLTKKGGLIYILNEPWRDISFTDYFDTFINKLIYNKKDLIPAAFRGFFNKEMFWDYNTRLADYQLSYQKGLPFDNIKECMKKRNFEVISNEKYTMSHYKIFYLLNKYIFCSLNGWFKIIAQKK
jgi:ubiquinone/menaquinone biosynthesis C-methylase UbiE